MFNTIRNAWKIVDLRKKLLYTCALLIIFRLGSCIPVPMLEPEQMRALFNSENTIFGFIDMVSGGAFQNATIFAMSITPYINSSIIMQLLCVAIPALERMQKEGEDGRKKIAQIQRYGTVVLALIQATGLYFLLDSYNAVTNPGFTTAAVVIITFTAGTAFLMWLGEQITEKGVGNGISLIIFAGIVSRIPSMIASAYCLYAEWYAEPDRRHCTVDFCNCNHRFCCYDERGREKDPCSVCQTCSWAQDVRRTEHAYSD